MPLLVARIPKDYFAALEPPPSRFARQHPLVRLTLRVLRNLLGLVLILLGVALLLLPGQGLLTILVGMLLVEGPGKRRLELFVVRRRGIRRAIDWIRRRAGRPPLVVWEPPEPGEPEPG